MPSDTQSAVATPEIVKSRLDLGALPFVLSVFLGATLIFLVQPMFAKMATPLLGGSPSVWNVSLVCFQAALLGGYGYAHLLARLRSVKAQVAIHAVLLAAGAICLPMGMTGVFGDPDPQQPALWLIGVFAVSVALPFGAVSATAPLVQSWYARTTRPDAGDPYHLYAASNIGSLIGLAAYPLLMEPFTQLATQSQSWAVGYGVLFLLLMMSGVAAFRQNGGGSTTVSTVAERVPLAWKERGIWLALAFVPSSLMVGATTHITTDVAAAPFLWVPPLTLYILTFVFVFAKTPLIPQSVILRFLPVVIAAVAFMLTRMVDFGWPVELGFTLLALFWVSMACHGQLAARRPHVSRLTEFYLIMSLGGVLGGAFNALLAPVIFESILEYPIILAASLFVVPAIKADGLDRMGRLLLFMSLGAMAIALMFRTLGVFPDRTSVAALIAIAALGIVLARGRRIIMVLSFAASFIVATALDPVSGGQSDRGFFGIVRVLEGDGTRAMMHGTTLHGAQLQDEARSLTPLTYYAPQTPIGQVFQLYDDVQSVGVVGLGVGSVACYSQPGQDWVFYEIDPIVVDIATNPNQFTFMPSCQPDARIEIGDARIQMRYEEDGLFDLLLLDAFSSDSIPVHLVTREAMQLYISKLSEDGVFIAHISNRHLALEQVFARIAEEEGLVSYVQRFSPEDRAAGFEVTPTHAMLFARNDQALQRALDTGLWREIHSDGGRAWTDDYSNILGAMIAQAHH